MSVTYGTLRSEPFGDELAIILRAAAEDGVRFPSDGWVDAGVDRLAAWLRAKGARVTFKVSSEEWHLVLSQDDLVRLASELDDPLRLCTRSERDWIREYDRLEQSGEDAERRRVLRRSMQHRRKRVWRIAQPQDRGGDGHGWEHANRRARYFSLLARTK